MLTCLANPCLKPDSSPRFLSKTLPSHLISYSSIGEKLPLCTLSQWPTHVWIIFHSSLHPSTHSSIWSSCPITLKSPAGRGYALSTSVLGVSLYTKELSKYQLNWFVGWVVEWMVNLKSIYHTLNYSLSPNCIVKGGDNIPYILLHPGYLDWDALLTNDAVVVWMKMTPLYLICLNAWSQKENC